MSWIIGGVGVMTGPAGAPLYRLIDMDEVQVLISVSEPCQSLCFGIQDHCFFVAVEAEIKILRLEGSVKHGIEILPEYPEVVRPMGVVAARTISLPYGAVVVLIRLEVLLHIHYLSIRRIQGTVVAHHACINGFLHELLYIVGDVGVMACKAFPLCFEAAMFRLHFFGPFFLVFVASKA